LGIIENSAKRSFQLIAGLAFIGISACATENLPKNAGFLNDYSKLTKSPFADAEGAYSYFNPGKPLNLYSNFIILPVQIRQILSPSAPPYINQKDMQKLADYFYYRLKKELKNSNYSIVSEPRSQTLILRVAITNLEPFQPLARMRATISEATIWGGASAEAELIDALTGEVVVAVIDLQKGRVYNKSSKYGLVKEVIERWSKRLITRMDEAHRKNP